MSGDLFNLSSVWNGVYQGSTFFSSLFTCVVAGYGSYLIIFKKNIVNSYFNSLTNITLQKTASELEHKLDKLNDINAEDRDPLRIQDMLCLLSEIDGQIEGNVVLKKRFEKEQSELIKFISQDGGFSEPKKRRLVSLLREKIKTLNDEIYRDLANEGKR